MRVDLAAQVLLLIVRSKLNCMQVLSSSMAAALKYCQDEATTETVRFLWTWIQASCHNLNRRELNSWILTCAIIFSVIPFPCESYCLPHGSPKTMVMMLRLMCRAETFNELRSACVNFCVLDGIVHTYIGNMRKEVVSSALPSVNEKFHMQVRFLC